MTDTIPLDVVDRAGLPVGVVRVPADLFDAPVNIPLMHQVVVAQQAAARQGTHATKTRGQVSGGGVKPWRQKGTGRARQGSRRAPQWAGGGTAHGPQPRSYAQRTNKKMIAAALRCALSDRRRDGRLFVLDHVVAGEVPSTKQALQALAAVCQQTTVIVVLSRDEDAAWMSLRNVPTAHVIVVDQLNTYDVLVNQAVVFSQAALTDYLARHGVTLEVEPAARAQEGKVAQPGKPKTDTADETVETDGPEEATAAKTGVEPAVAEADAEEEAE